MIRPSLIVHDLFWVKWWEHRIHDRLMIRIRASNSLTSMRTAFWQLKQPTNINGVNSWQEQQGKQKVRKTENNSHPRYHKRTGGKTEKVDAAAKSISPQAKPPRRHACWALLKALLQVTRFVMCSCFASIPKRKIPKSTESTALSLTVGAAKPLKVLFSSLLGGLLGALLGAGLSWDAQTRGPKSKRCGDQKDFIHEKYTWFS